MATKPLNPVGHKTLFRIDFTPSLSYLSIYSEAAAKIEATGYSRFEVDGSKISLF